MYKSQQVFAVVYAKILVDKKGIRIHNVYFGGIENTKQAAEKSAKECVNLIKGGTILAKVFPLKNGGLIDVMFDAYEKFEDLVKRMQEADEIINRKNIK